jgi:phosphatidylglycerol:prolipoprotein diacylglycerol transferase
MYPMLFELFGISISSFGFMMAIGVVLGSWVGANRFEEQGYSRETAWTMAIWALVGGLIGAKLWFLAERWVRHPEAFELATLVFGSGGLTWYGGAVGGVVGVSLGRLRERIPLWTVLNLGTFPGLVAQSIGRIGCFLVGDDYGRASDVPWAMAFPKGAPPTLERVHPTMLYDSAWLALCILILWPRRRSPALFAEYLMLTGFGRFANEFLRVNPPLLGPFSNAQVVALLCVSGGAVLWFWARRSAAAATLAPAPAAAPKAAERTRRRRA